MNIFLVTDLHFNHTDQMVRYCGRPADYEERIFKEMLKLKSTDVLICLGDVCVGKDAEMHKRYIEPLICRKWLLRGNHDSKTNTWYLNHGWDWVGDWFGLTTCNKNIIFSHRPTKILDSYDLNIFGHFHNHLPRLLKHNWVVDGEEERNKEDLEIMSNKHKVLSMEKLDYKLITLENFIYDRY